MSFQVRMSGPDLKAAYNAVRDGDPDTEWAIYTYLNNGGDLVVQETGVGGLDTMCTKFSPTRVQHAFARVEDPRMHGDKFILIHWCGDDAPAGPRRFFAINSGVIGSLLKGAQVTFTASDEHDITPEAIMKRLIGQGTASEVPKAPAKSLFRRATESYRAPTRASSSWIPVEKPVPANLKPVQKAQFAEPAVQTMYSPILTEEPEEMDDPFNDPPPPPPPHDPAPVQRSPPPIATTTTAPPTTAPPAARPAPTRGLTWGERLAAKRRQDTIDEERSQQAIRSNVVRLNTFGGPDDTNSSLTWSQRQAAAKQKAEEEERARLAEIEFQENERRLKELEERIRAEKEALEAEFALHEEEERRRQEEEEYMRQAIEEEKRREREEEERRKAEQRQMDEMARHQEELRRLEQLKAERKRQEELAARLAAERQERERHEALARQMEEERKAEERKRLEEQARFDALARQMEEERQVEAQRRLDEMQRLELKLREMEEARVAAERKEQALRAEALRREREAEEQLKLAELRLREAEEERLAAIQAKKEEEAARLREAEEAKRADTERKMKLEREERDRRLTEERLMAEKNEAETIRAAEIQRLQQRVRELELRREAASIEERAAKLRQEQEKKKRLELEEIAERERQEKERILATRLAEQARRAEEEKRQQEEEARRRAEEEDHFREFEALHNRVMEMERLALQEGSARDKAAAAEREARQRLRQAEERAARLLAEKEAMLREKLEEQARIRAAAEELARRRSESEAGGTRMPTPEIMDPLGEDSGADKKRRVALPKRAPGGWTPLQGGGFAFERARNLVRTTSDSPRESPPYLKNAAKDLSSFFVVDYGGKPQSDFAIPLPHH